MRRAIDVLISVPFNWPAGSTKGHLHDPVDLVACDYRRTH